MQAASQLVEVEVEVAEVSVEEAEETEDGETLGDHECIREEIDGEEGDGLGESQDGKFHRLLGEVWRMAGELSMDGLIHGGDIDA